MIWENLLKQKLLIRNCKSSFILGRVLDLEDEELDLEQYASE